METKRRPDASRNGPAAKRRPGGMPPPPTDAEIDRMIDEEADEGDEDVFLDDVVEAEAALVDVGDEVDEAQRSKWRRPAPPPMNSSRDSLVFQQLDIDYVVGRVHGNSFGQVAGGRISQAPILRAFGVTANGEMQLLKQMCRPLQGTAKKSCEATVYARIFMGFFPTSMLECLSTTTTPIASSYEDLGARKGNPGGVHVVSVALEEKQSLMKYQTNRKKFVKITVALPNLVTSARSAMESGIKVCGSDQVFPTYESNVLFVLRFMVDCNVSGGNWLELPAASYQLVSEGITKCQIEVDIMFDKLISHPAEGVYSRLAPVRILSFDIECAGRKGFFPDAKEDSVIQIANMVTEQGQRTPVIRNVLTLGSCLPIVGADVLQFDDEKKLLLAWRDLVWEADPDIIIGYNISNFDLPYLLNRAEALKVNKFPYFGRIRGSKIRMKDTTFSSRAYGTRESKEITIEGRVQFDVLQALQRDYKLSSYSLNAVSAHFLGEQKEDVHHSIISDLQNGSAETRHRLAIYCLKDAYLPQRLMDKLMFMYNYIEMARVTGVPLSFLLARGQSIKVMSQILRKARQRGLLVPNQKVEGGQDTYEGATVLEAKAGFYNVPIATLDFASLYPSIMMAHNLCYCTLVNSADVASLPADQVSRTPSGDLFVKPALQKGILPEILEELLSARKRAKADLKAATDVFEKAVLDGRQLALKVSANSVYGFTGALVGKLPCLEISSSVTAYGRQMIEHTKKMVEEKYTIANGYPADADVMYGDTDSVMVKFGVKTVDKAMELGREAAQFVSATFIKPIKLEFEKVYFPYLLISKKRYAGLLWTNPEKADKMDTKGIETVRRDNCLLVKNVITTCLEKILIDKDVEGAIEYVKRTITDLLMNRMDLSLLVITKGLTKAGASYEVKAAHVELAERMRKRDPATAPNVGDRVAYVIIKAHQGAKAYEKSEDPIYVLENNLPIDTKYYLEQQLKKPLERIFEPIMKNPQSLLSGDHTRSVFIPVPSVGGIMKFAKKTLSCLGCKTAITQDEQTLCRHCRQRESELYYKSLRSVNELEDQFARLWTQCQRCQGSLHQDVLCTSRDCPIFYRRKKVQKDLGEAQGQLARFQW
eukprot:jgi/Chlat1/7671/Chrsp64S09160